MPKFSLIMSAESNGEIFHNSYNFETTRPISEEEILQSYEEFYPAYTGVKIVSFQEVGTEEEVC